MNNRAAAVFSSIGIACQLPRRVAIRSTSILASHLRHPFGRNRTDYSPIHSVRRGRFRRVNMGLQQSGVRHRMLTRARYRRVGEFVFRSIEAFGSAANRDIAPSAAKASAIARPMPRLAPVTITPLPSRPNSILSTFVRQRCDAIRNFTEDVLAIMHAFCSASSGVLRRCP